MFCIGVEAGTLSATHTNLGQESWNARPCNTKKRVRGDLFIPMILVTAASIRNFLLWNSIGRFFASWNLFPFLLSRMEFQLVTPMEDEAGNQVFQAETLGKTWSIHKAPSWWSSDSFPFQPKAELLRAKSPPFLDLQATRDKEGVVVLLGVRQPG